MLRKQTKAALAGESRSNQHKCARGEVANQEESVEPRAPKLRSETAQSREEGG